VIGGGMSGTIFAAERVRLEKRDPLVLFERNARFGRGPAYATTCDGHRLNVPAHKMSAFEGDPSHFVRWLDGSHAEHAFVPRERFGAYLEDVAREALSNGAVRVVRGDVVDVERDASGFVVRTREGDAVQARAVVLAIGPALPGDAFLPADIRNSDLYHRDPWRREIGAVDGDVILFGSGLTALDVVASLEAGSFRGHVHLVSRHGRMPLAHAPIDRHMENVVEGTSALALLRSFRAAARERDWSAMVNAVRPHIPRLWMGLPIGEKRRFLRHLRSLWNVHRHRAAPEVNAVRQRFERADRLTLHRGRIIGATAKNGLLAIEIATVTGVQHIEAALAVNCTGPQYDPTRIDDPLVRHLLERGLVARDPLGLGFASTPNGEAIAPDDTITDGMYTLGWMRTGTMFESAALGELRAQALALAQML
jgi:uncharacterized NAD(P)/FAD-binding protein YdhS